MILPDLYYPDITVNTGFSDFRQKSKGLLIFSGEKKSGTGRDPDSRSDPKFSQDKMKVSTYIKTLNNSAEVPVHFKPF
jgi:hypothetical protein